MQRKFSHVQSRKRMKSTSRRFSKITGAFSITTAMYEYERVNLKIVVAAS